MAIQISGTQVIGNSRDLTNIRNIEAVSGWASQAIDSLSGTSVTPNFDNGNNFSLTLSGTTTINNPSNITAGQSGVIFITQDGTGGRTVAFGSYWSFVDGTAPTITSTASAKSALYYVCRTTTDIFVTSTLNVS